MANRDYLKKRLIEILGTNNVYFQPPESIKITYPCIIYSLNGIENRHASNSIYKTDKIYTVIYITNNPDDEVVDKLNNEQYSRYDRNYKSGNLYHYVFTFFNIQLGGTNNE